MKSPQISIIVPVYGAEKYMSRCLDSILSQTFYDFELLLINDGSVDKSGLICEQYAKIDKRIRVFHKENGGVSSARQVGIDNAQGTYTIHVDPDDWIEKNMLQDLYESAISEQADLVICDFWKEISKKLIYCKQRPHNFSSRNVLYELFLHLHGSCCNKLLRAECYQKYKIQFPFGLNYCEDVIFWVQVLQTPIKIVYLPKAYYHYDQIINQSSLTRSYSSSTINQHLLYIEYLNKYLDRRFYKKENSIAILNVAYDEFIHNSLYDKRILLLTKKVRKNIFFMAKPLIAKVIFFIALFFNRKVGYCLFNFACSTKKTVDI